MTGFDQFMTVSAALLAVAACRAEPEASPIAAPPPSASLEHPDGGQNIEERIALVVRTSTGSEHRFTVEVARTDAQQTQGLMFRRSLAPDQGMLFPYQPPAQQSFWMRNTVIPLDIIFVRADGSIARVAARTTPYSLEPIPSIDPVVGVLEIDGGRAAELGIAAGDYVSWPGGPVLP